MNLTERVRGTLTRPHIDRPMTDGQFAAHLRRFAARVVVFSLLTFVLAFGAAMMRSVGIFEEDRHDSKHRVEIVHVQSICQADHRHRLPDFMPWGAGFRLSWTPLRLHCVETAPVGFYQTGPPPSRAPPERLT